VSPGTDIDQVRAEAAAWLARLRSDQVGAQDQAGFQSWLAEDPRHGAAFEAVTGTWDLLGGAQISRPIRHVELEPSKIGRRTLLLGAALVVAGGAGIALWYRQPPDIFATGSGEQRRLLLSDGSSVILDTDTQISVRMTASRREIALDRGRAFFEVAANPDRPFEVTASGRKVVAVGTAFEVKLDGTAFVATLQHGVVVVSDEAANAGRFVLTSGDRIAFASTGQTIRDRPDLSLVLAWRTGRLGFDRESLAAAVSEMNRYSRRPLVIGDASIAHLAISGLFTAGDTEAFARSVAALLPVTADIQPQQIVLTATVAKKSPHAY